ncbi:MAG: hypothetical protein Q8O55_07125 [Dehalococcoidales bacterium]|nr:hypothetical protein [Dehalococcoidales bacterium]
MDKDIIEVTIIAGQEQDCQHGCGLDWSSPAVLALASQNVQERFGDKVKLTYLGPSQARENNGQGREQKLMEDQNLPFPRLAVNGQVRISGMFDIRQLLDAVEVEMELGE